MIPGYAGFGHDLLTTSLTTAAASASSLKPIEDAFALAFDRVVMASAVGIMTPVPNISDGSESSA